MNLDSINQWFLDYIYSNDMIYWNKPFDKPLLTNSNDEISIDEPIIIKDLNLYKIFYSAKLLKDHKNYIKYGTSTDGFNWQIDTKPILEPSYSWERRDLFNPYVLKKENVFYLWYQAWRNDGIWRIGLATSTDSYQWEKNQIQCI